MPQMKMKTLKEMMTYIIIHIWPNEIKKKNKFDGDIKFIIVNLSPDEIKFKAKLSGDIKSEYKKPYLDYNAFNHLLDKCIGFHRYSGTKISLDYYIKNIHPKEEEFTDKLCIEFNIGVMKCVWRYLDRNNYLLL